MKTIIHKSFSKGVDIEKKLVKHINNSLTDDVMMMVLMSQMKNRLKLSG